MFALFNFEHLERELASPVTLKTVLAGFSYVWSRPVLLGAISLDLFAVLLGTVTALLPVFAKDILQTGPWGLGLLRSSPALGAILVTVVLSHVSLERGVGTMLFASVATLFWYILRIVMAFNNRD